MFKGVFNRKKTIVNKDSSLSFEELAKSDSNGGPVNQTNDSDPKTKEDDVNPAVQGGGGWFQQDET